jgi:hypothetical protein
MALSKGEDAKTATSYTLRSITELRRTHNLGTWALFVDLHKAFDTADHNLLYKLLEIYRAPENIINLVKHLHDDFCSQTQDR